MKRYSPGFAAEVWQFVSMQFDSDWQSRSGGRADRGGGSGEGDEYMPKFMKAVADYTGHPEIEHAPVVMTPRQGRLIPGAVLLRK